MRASPVIQDEALLDNTWSLSPHKFILGINSSFVLAADVVLQRENETIVERRSILSFYPRRNNEQNASTLILQGNVEVTRMACIRDNHLLLVCRAFRCRTPLAADDETGPVLVAGRQKEFLSQDSRPLHTE